MKLESDWFLPAACYLVLERKMKRKDVASLFGVNPHTISDAIKRFEETGGHKNRTGQGSKRTARDEVHVEQVKTLTDMNNHTKKRNGQSGNSTRKIGKKLKISHESARQILEDDLRLAPWKKVKGQKLSEKQKKQRLERAKALKKRFAGGQHKRILFTDEKFFPIEKVHNPKRQNLGRRATE